jgi:predicted N-acetyltransferase YhbS
MNVIHDYRSDKALRDSFNQLAEQTFGLNFEGWYQDGFWKENYDPHSIVVDGEVVSNVSVNRTDLMIGGRRYRILQLGTVMTAQAHRGKGYGRAIMEYIEGEYAGVDGIYLFANETVVDYYPRFGFRPAVEYAYRKAVSQTGENRTEQVIMDNADSWAKLAEAMERSKFREGCPMVGNPGLIFFYVSLFLQEAVYYIPHLDAWVIAEPEEGCLTIHNIFAGEQVTIDDVAAAFGSEVREIALGFAPECAEGWEISEIHEEDTHFFVKGGIFGQFEEKKLRIPSLSHA